MKEPAMKDIRFTASPGVPHGTMEDEFLCHRGGSEWWYCTGYLSAESGRQFSFQFTLSKPRIHGITFNILMTALTDFASGRHYYSQQAAFFGRGVTITADRISLGDRAALTRNGGNLTLRMAAADYSLSLDMKAVKPAVWHCDGGVLRMGIDAPGQTTYYWSYTNLASSGRLVLGNEELPVTGKSWFDRQGGTYDIIDRWTHWEWFSLRFFDDEEIMLFSFPQDDYRDGTYIDRSGGSRRLNAYSITPLGFTRAGGKKFSFGWKIRMEGVKEEEYTIVPKMDGQLNLTYFELLADIKNGRGTVVGHCVVELLPGVYNEKIDVGAAWARIR
jgi:predicted secreted hydrolase